MFSAVAYKNGHSRGMWRWLSTLTTKSRDDQQSERPS